MSLLSKVKSDNVCINSRKLEKHECLLLKNARLNGVYTTHWTAVTADGWVAFPGELHCLDSVFASTTPCTIGFCAWGVNVCAQIEHRVTREHGTVHIMIARIVSKTLTIN
jgi:hypothetical protein